MEDALDVEGEDALEGSLVEFGQRRAPGGTRVVDQDVELVHLLRHLPRQPAALVLLGQIGREADTGAALRELGGDLGADVRLARRDVDRGASVDEPLGDHPADAAGAPGDESRLAADGEEVRGAHGDIVAQKRVAGPLNASREWPGPTWSRSRGPRPD